jgi:hypothetical protein
VEVDNLLRMNLFGWFNEIFLKMTWLENLVNWFFQTVFGIVENNPLHLILTFFVYDIIKIFIL